MHASKYFRIARLFCLIFSDIKMPFFALSFILYVLLLLGRNGFYALVFDVINLWLNLLVVCVVLLQKCG